MNSDGQIHNGADDNASGVSTMMELARIFAKIRLGKVNYVLCFFPQRKEDGLIGSKNLQKM